MNKVDRVLEEIGIGGTTVNSKIHARPKVVNVVLLQVVIVTRDFRNNTIFLWILKESSKKKIFFLI